jgi:hypothetical protein
MLWRGTVRKRSVAFWGRRRKTGVREAFKEMDKELS